ncbi:MAG: amphi-Trp domain-containing protein [Desulfomicrobium sp.]|jgi:amphi-Trp domain-containing protein|nr:amphi-Trp domain-containing protein [Pseudomonadota bacterium]MBV1712355.1 amphi-Trp domain-containing protein [Desulfomicrobium sp.]MBU4572515.1 amphi-Trp domain-containing protein [Pseudomonadota bacterium]MBU4595151.1 amphi-Trp domain-containing protein [Pseudomonadota bacterium]MBV1719630.1 amphi-Trp domain-containing protein [Desulfomicrobium sp.]
MSQDGKFEFESVQDCLTIQKYLEALQEGFLQGRIVLNSDGSEICLNPGGFMKFEVSVKKKGAENKLVIKVSWKDKRDEPPATGEISITS